MTRVHVGDSQHFVWPSAHLTNGCECDPLQVRDSVYTTAVVPADDVDKFGFKPAISSAAAIAGANQGNYGDGAQAGDDPELFRLALPRPGQPGGCGTKAAASCVTALGKQQRSV